VDLISIVAEVLDVPPGSLSENSGPESVAPWTSLAHISLMLAIEERLDVHFTMDEMAGARSIAQIREALQQKGVTERT